MFSRLRAARYLYSFITILVILGAVKAPAQTALFPVEPSITIQPVTGCPSCIVRLGGPSGDFNGDGIVDVTLVIGNQGNSPPISPASSYLVTLLGNKGQAPTQISTPLPQACGIWTIEAVDLNNDKKLDLVLSCTEGYIFSALGNGDGTFATPTLSPVPAGGGFTLADFNGDGLPDIAFLNNPNLGFSVALNTGSGQFGNPTSYSAPGVNAIAVGSGDFNGDGKQDLILGGGISAGVASSAAQAAYLLGNGDATFGPPQPLAKDVGPFVVADFNHDGFSDLAYSSGSALVLLSGSSAGLEEPGQSTPTSGAVISYLFVADLTGSGALDLIASCAAQNVLVFLPDGKSGFTAPLSYAPGYFFALADLNGDGILDLVGIGSGTSLNFAPGIGDGTFAALPNTPNGQQTQQPVTADMNGDGLIDVVLFDANKNPLVFLSRGDGRFVPTPNAALPIPISGVLSPSGAIAATADFNGDGKVDVVSIQPGYFPVPVMGPEGPPVYADFSMDLGNGDGTLTFKAQTQLSVFGVLAAVSGDFDGDKKQDLVMIYQEKAPSGQNGAVFLHGNGDGTFAAAAALNLLGNSPTPVLVAAADLNGDGIEDLVIADKNGTVTGYLATGNGTFTFAPQNLSLAPRVMLLADVTGDGKPELIALTNNLAIYGGNGDGTFTASPLFTAPVNTPINPLGFITQAGGLTVGDLNGDGLPDIGITTDHYLDYSTIDLNVFLNAGNGGFTADPSAYFAGSDYLSGPLAFVRLNSNGPASGSKQTLDALTYTNGGLTALLNQSNPAPKPVPTVTVSLADGVSGIVSGTQVTITAQLSAALSTAPTGTVQFYAGGSQIGTASVTGSTATLTYPITGSGPTTIRAVYSGDTNFSSAFGFTSVSVTNPTPTTTTLSASATSVNEQQSVTLTASVTGTSPSGTVTFLSGTTSLGTATLSDGTASFTTSFSNAGNLSLTASYGGDANNLPSVSAAVTLAVAAPDFAVSTPASSASVSPGQSASFTFTVTPSGGFSSAVTFTCSPPLPTGVNCAFNPSSVTPANGQPGTTKLTISTAAPSAAVQQAASRTRNRSPWRQGEAIVSLAGLLGFFFGRSKLTGAMRRSGLYLLILPAIACMLSLSSCGGSGSGNKTPTTPGTPTGTASVTVTAAVGSGGPQHTTAVTIVVN
jgi:hypothetical protein